MLKLLCIKNKGDSMENILRKCIDKFNNEDHEYYKQDIENEDAYNWMKENIPLIEIPDKTIEEIYYFRWWVFRKHIKNTPDGFVVTEFLPEVPWGGTYNTIIAAAGHHIAEAKWLKCRKRIVEDYLKLWLLEKSKTYLYSSWIIYALYEYCIQSDDFSFAIDNLELLVNYYKKTEEEHMTQCGLMWSFDNNDAMEYSISGTTSDFEVKKGLRPTLNSYMAANAYAISKIAEKSGDYKLSEEYYEKYLSLKEKITDILWDKDFYKAIHSDDFKNPSVDKIEKNQNVKELIGYIPWWFNLAPEGFENAFLELKSESGFLSDYGLTTAEKRHSRFLYKADHECLWNGYIWPFATSQVLNSVISVINNYKQNVIDKNDFYNILKSYAKMHYISNDDGKKVCWIDEAKNPETNEWECRKILENMGWVHEKGGFERGKDYNHSTFCDIVLKGLLGVNSGNGELLVSPLIPDEWDEFKIRNLWLNDKCYKIEYTKGIGIKITEIL